jgi:hypothetical protein
MADREQRALSNGAVGFVDGVDGATLIREWKLDPTNVAAVTSLVDADVFFVSVSNVVKAITLANLKTELVLPVRVPILATFPGLCDTVTGAGNVTKRQLRIPGYSGKTNTIKGATIIGSSEQFGTSGSTQVAASDTDYTDNTNEIIASATYGAGYGTESTGSIALVDGYIYLYLLNAAKHSDVQVLVWLEIS